MCSCVQAMPTLYIATNSNTASEQIKKCLYTNYLQYGSDQYEYDMDAWRNSLMDKVNIVIVEWPNHNEIFCPAIKVGEGLEWQPLPDGIFPEDACWLFVIEYIVDIWEFESRWKKWFRLEKMKVRVLHFKHFLATHPYDTLNWQWDNDNEYYYDSEDLIRNYKKYFPNFKYKPAPEPEQIKTPIPWEYK